MTNSHNPESKVLSAMRLVEANDSSNIRLNANGGNSILLVCEPTLEQEYISTIKLLMNSDKYELIDLNELLCKFVSTNKNDLEETFDLLKGSLPQIFRTPAGEDGPDLFGLIVSAIGKSFAAGKVPVLTHSGALYGTGIENIHIMENDMVMKASLPMIILYPATKDNDKLMFLGCRSSSKYRCMIID